MKFLFSVIVFIGVASLCGGIAVIVYRRRTIEVLRGFAAEKLTGKVKEAASYIKDHLVMLNKKFTGMKRYGEVNNNLSILNLDIRVSKEYFVLIEECSITGVLLICLLLTGDLAISLCFAAASFFAPYYLLKSRVMRKKEAIVRELPDAFDIIGANIEGGLSLSASLRRYAAKAGSDFGAELYAAIKKMELGSGFEDAMRSMDTKLGIRELNSFINAFVQAEKSGGSIKEIIKGHAAEIRNKRFQYLKKKAHEAPVKLLIPLLLFIFPVIFIVLFGPVVIKLLNGI